MHRALPLDTDPVTSSRVTRTRARTNESDITQEHGFGCSCNEHKGSVDESGRLDEANKSFPT